MVAAEDRKMDEISRAAQSTLNDRQAEAGNGQIDSEAKALRLKGGVFLGGQSLSTILLTLMAILSAGSAFFPGVCGIRLFTK